MMYLAFYGLQESPFSITPDTSFFYAYQSHREALDVLLVALRSGEGFLKVTGEVGTGKTLLCRKLLDTLGEDFVTAWIPNPQMSADELRLAVLEELGVADDALVSATPHTLLKHLSRCLIDLHAKGKRVVLLIDEAQALPEEALEAVRLLTNLETRKRKLLQVVLLGQPELDETLERTSIRQLKQRITFAYRLKPLDRASVADYVAHRLSRAGYNGPALFSPGAISRIAEASGGIPRLINVLAHKSLMVAYGKGQRRIEAAHVKAAVADTEGAVQGRGLFLRWWPLGVMLASALLLLTAGWELPQ